MPHPTLTDTDNALLRGDGGGAAQLAMRLIVRLARALDAPALRDVTRAHIDGCLYHGQASLDFAARLVALGGQVRVPTTLNVSSLDLLHPARYRGVAATGTAARRLMDAYVALGCRATWTCAPYQLPDRPAFGEHIAWAESNAIVFANSVLGARTNRYGDFIDICAALTGRVPDSGLHRDEERRGRILFTLRGLPDRLLSEDILYPILGHLVGLETGTAIPVIDGLPPTATEDNLKAFGAATASSGAVALFHIVGRTPEAPTLEAALGGLAPERTIDVTPSSLAAARDALTTAASPRLDAVSLGTPHFSLAEFAQLVPLLDGVRVAPGIEFFVSTGRHILEELGPRGWRDICERAGVQFVVDTCTYITPILRARARVAMTNSAKWAYYAPGNLGLDVVFGSLRECVESAVRGEVWRDRDLWADL
jgi:predicted aconitase